MILWYNSFQLKTKVPHGGNHRDTVNLCRRLTLNTIPQNKICSKCKELKSVDCFHPDKSKKSGYASYCKSCRSVYLKKYRSNVANHEKAISYGRKYYKDNKEEILEKQKIYVKNNWDWIYKAAVERKNKDRDGYLSYLKNYYHSNKHKTVEKRRDSLRRWKQNNREYVRERDTKYRKENSEKFSFATRRWAKNNPEKVRRISHARRARLLNADGNYTVEEWVSLKRKYNYACLCCGIAEPDIKLTVDHVIPLYLGGSNFIDNIQPLCFSCNSRKGIKIIDYRLEAQHD